MNQINNLPYYLYLSKVKGIGNVKLNQILQKNKRLKITIQDFFYLFEKELQGKYKFIQNHSKKEIVNYLSHLDEEKRTLEKLVEQSIHPILISDSIYPKKLKSSLGLSAPPILYLKGNPNLLTKRHFAIVGTRAPSKAGIDVTQCASRSFSSKNFTIISGYAKGIDHIAHNSALDSNGNTILILGCGMFHYSKKPIRHEENLDDNLLVVSEFYPTCPWHRGYLMTRNITICGLADGVLVVEAKEDGGAFHTGSYALMLKKPTYTITFHDDSICNLGNKRLIEKGATAIPFQPVDLLSSNFQQMAQSLLSKDYSSNDDQYHLFDEISEKIKKYIKFEKPFPILSFNKLLP